MPTPDIGHEQTEKLLEELERRLASVYRIASKEMQDKITAYFESFAKRDAEMRALIGTEVNGKEWTEQDYKQWRLNQIGRGKRFETLRDQLAERMTKANEVAAAYINDAAPSVYSLNRNYTAYTIEQVGGNVGFTLWDESTVKRLLKEEPDLMPYYPQKRAVKREIDLAWGKKQITSQITQSILQGENLKAMADRLQKAIPTMNRDSAIRAARTAFTGAQNGGRMDSYKAAEKMGIKVRKRWVATKDGRTRHSHRRLDGQTVGWNKEFSNGCRYPGDPRGKHAEVYNCRCTMRTVEKNGIEAEPRQMRVRDPKTGRNVLVNEMTYDEWESWKKDGKSDIIKQTVNQLQYKRFDTGESVNDFFYYDGEERGLMARKRSKYKQWEKALTPEEKTVISDYSTDGYDDINKYWRKIGDWENIDQAKVLYQTEKIDKAIASFELKDNLKVYRGISLDAIADMFPDVEELSDLVGKAYGDKSFSGTSSVSEVAKRFVEQNGQDGVMLELDIPEGKGRRAYLDVISAFGESIVGPEQAEYEFLLKRDARFEIYDVDETGVFPVLKGRWVE